MKLAKSCWVTPQVTGGFLYNRTLCLIFDA